MTTTTPFLFPSPVASDVARPVPPSGGQLVSMLLDLAGRVGGDAGHDPVTAVHDLVTVARGLSRAHRDPDLPVRLDASSVRITLTGGLHGNPHAAMADAMHRVREHGGSVATTAGAVRAVFARLPDAPPAAWLAVHDLDVLPAALPDAADDAPVVLFDVSDAVGRLVAAAGRVDTGGGQAVAGFVQEVLDGLARRGPAAGAPVDGRTPWGDRAVGA
ncbi:hypothetical protein [Saccharothrix sp. HUAS TT1]|uniref:hypothetical protein n=1 Tax=unclassified Saccharothrix TaxID=2593673 RepID=UPI00345C1474